MDIVSNSEIKKGKELVKKAKTLLKTINLNEKKKLIYDVKADLKFNEQADFVYSTIISVLKEYFKNDPTTFEELIKRIQEKLKVHHK